RFKRADRPRHVKRVRERVVDRLDVVVSQQRLVRAMDARDAEVVRERPSARLVARPHRKQLDARVARSRDQLRIDVRGAHDAPAHGSPYYTCLYKQLDGRSARMRLHFISRLALLVGAGFLVVASQVWSGDTLEWLFIAGGIVMVAAAAIDAEALGRAQRSLDGLIAALGVWS